MKYSFDNPLLSTNSHTMSEENHEKPARTASISNSKWMSLEHQTGVFGHVYIQMQSKNDVLLVGVCKKII
jgi:hypothetical protein